MRTLDNLRKSAKRWFKALQAGDSDAQARLRRVFPNAPDRPVLREVQQALARERGFETWAALQRAHSDARLERYAGLAQDVFSYWHAADLDAHGRLEAHYRQSFTLDGFRAGIAARLAAFPDGRLRATGLSQAEARLVVAREAGFADWTDLETGLARIVPAARIVEPSPAAEDGHARMLRPVELRAPFAVRLDDGVMTSTAHVWRMLSACLEGDESLVKALLDECPALLRCDYNYMTPLHLAVREGHEGLVGLLADRGAANPNYVTYPYRESLVTVATDRGFENIARLLQTRYETGDATRPEDEGGEIVYPMDDEQRRFQKLLNGDKVGEVERLLEGRPELAVNPYTFWSEGALMMPAKRAARPMIELLIRHGARVPDVSKWGAWYYLEHYDIAALLLDHGMDPDHMNCHRTTVLHDLAWKNDVLKAALLIDNGADVNAIDEEFRSTPLGLAARWGHREMVELLLARGAAPTAAGAPWAAPLAWAERRGHTAVAALVR